MGLSCRIAAWNRDRGTLYRAGDRSGEVLLEDCDAGGGELGSIMESLPLFFVQE